MEKAEVLSNFFVSVFTGSRYSHISKALNLKTRTWGRKTNSLQEKIRFKTT